MSIACTEKISILVLKNQYKSTEKSVQAKVSQSRKKQEFFTILKKIYSYLCVTYLRNFTVPTTLRCVFTCKNQSALQQTDGVGAGVEGAQPPTLKADESPGRGLTAVTLRSKVLSAILYIKVRNTLR